MKTAYSVLWIDDNLRNQKLIKKQLEKQLFEYGLDLEVDYRKGLSMAEADSVIKEMKVYNRYDAILVDHNLSGDQKGVSLAKMFRNARIYTMVVYYSSDMINTLRESVRNFNLDGVYVMNRGSMKDDLWEIIQQQVSREFDVNNMRGYVLDTMSYVEAFLRKYMLAQVGPDNQQLLEKIKHKATSVARTTINRIGKLKFNGICKEILSGGISFETVRQLIVESLPEERKTILSEASKLVNLQRRRNVFAHRMHKIDAETHKVLFDGDKIQSDGYSSADFTSLRKDLLVTRKELEQNFL